MMRSRRAEGGETQTTRDARRSEVGRFDVVCGPEVAETVLRLATHWGATHALAEVARARLTSLVRASLEHGLRFDPRAVTLVIRWLDRDRVRLDVRWHGSASIPNSPVTPGGVTATIATLDTVADQWGFTGSAGDPVHWMILDVASASA